MRGSVQRSGDGWLFVVDAGLDHATGRRHQIRRRGFRTKKEAGEALATLITDRSRGLTSRPTRTTLQAFLLDEWLPAKRASLRPSTAAVEDAFFLSPGGAKKRITKARAAGLLDGLGRAAR